HLAQVALTRCIGRRNHALRALRKIAQNPVGEVLAPTTTDADLHPNPVRITIGLPPSLQRIGPPATGAHARTSSTTLSGRGWVMELGYAPRAWSPAGCSSKYV